MSLKSANLHSIDNSDRNKLLSTTKLPVTKVSTIKNCADFMDVCMAVPGRKVENTLTVFHYCYY